MNVEKLKILNDGLKEEIEKEKYESLSGKDRNPFMFWMRTLSIVIDAILEDQLTLYKKLYEYP